MLWYWEIRQKLPAGSVNAVIVCIFIMTSLPAVAATDNTKCSRKGSNALDVVAIVIMKYITTVIPALKAIINLIIHMIKS
jgi:hypothetical protein